MRVTVIDQEALRSPSPRNIRLYLRSRGWSRAGAAVEVPDVWQLSSDEGMYEVIAPTSREARDFGRLVAELLRTLSIVEDRSELAVMRDLVTLSFDIQYVHTHHGGLPGTAPLPAAVEAFSAAQTMLAAAAATLDQPQLILPSRRPTSATQLLRRVLAGPTEEGSYVLSLWVPIPPRLTQEEDAVLFDTDDEPYERSVTRWLNQALGATRAAARAAIVGDEGLEAFVQGEPLGISATLLESLVALSGDEEHPIEVSFAWSLARPVIGLPPRIDFPNEVIPVLREAARELRIRIPEEATRIRGNIVRLHREGQLGPGEVTIAGIVTDDPIEKLRRVTVDLPESDYQRAITAHETYADVEIIGTLVQRGTRTYLREAHSFAVLPSPS